MVPLECLLLFFFLFWIKSQQDESSDVALADLVAGDTCASTSTCQSRSMLADRSSMQHPSSRRR